MAFLDNKTFDLTEPYVDVDKGSISSDMGESSIEIAEEDMITSSVVDNMHNREIRRDLKLLNALVKGLEHVEGLHQSGPSEMEKMTES
jgi:hypothetical protein